MAEQQDRSQASEFAKKRNFRFTNDDLVQRNPLSVTRYDMDSIPQAPAARTPLDDLLDEGLTIEDILANARDVMSAGQGLNRDAQAYGRSRRASDALADEVSPMPPGYKAVTSPLRGAALAGSFIPGPVGVGSAAIGSLLAGGEALYEGRPGDAALEAVLAAAPAGIRGARSWMKGRKVSEIAPGMAGGSRRALPPGRRVFTGPGAPDTSGPIPHAPAEYPMREYPQLPAGREPLQLTEGEPWRNLGRPEPQKLLGPGEDWRLLPKRAEQSIESLLDAEPQAAMYRQRRNKRTAGFNVPEAGSDIDRIAASIARILGE